ncbi:DUF2218 domain-containing protein [Acidocella sp.]|uniref:DUF2218 domain-containing protein n=1 Tax=Acidocella sp. TaxID=50710 RepID=UPI00260871A6|nr:DUF2218 domain-containing protein [Acidocella sp.]
MSHPPAIAHAVIKTGHARRYLGQFVKHFAHKLETARAETNDHGEVNFPIGQCRLNADDTSLSLTLAAPPAEMPKLQDVVARHLVRFGFREELAISWAGAEWPWPGFDATAST